MLSAPSSAGSRSSFHLGRGRLERAWLTVLLYTCVLLVPACKDDGELGAPCAESDPCDQGSVSESGSNPFCNVHYLGGQCSQQCETDDECVKSWGEGAVCIVAGYCVRSCAEDKDCPKGTTCNEYMWCDRESHVESPGRLKAEQWAQAYCDAAFADCNCSTEDSFYASKDECIQDQLGSFLILLDDSRVSLDDSCLAERISALNYLQCDIPRGGYDWEKRACPVFHGTIGYKESCESGNTLMSQCAQGLVCLWTRYFDGRCEEDYRLPGVGEDCALEEPQCADGLRCNGAQCIDYPDIGEECSCDAYGCTTCAEGWCSADTLTCEPPLPAGEECDIIAWDRCDWRHGALCSNDVCTDPAPIACILR